MRVLAVAASWRSRSHAFTASAGSHDRQPEPVLDFIYDRLRGYLRDQGYSANQVAAVLDARPDSIADLPSRLAAVQAFAALPEAAALSAANKRIVNILRKSGSEAAARSIRARLADGAEHDLYMTFAAPVAAGRDRLRQRRFRGALRALATAKPAVDRYFDDVMVMADDPAIRANRLALAARRGAYDEPRRRHLASSPNSALMVQLASEAVVPTRAVKLIVLDRDGVINYDSDQFIKAPDEWRPVPGQRRGDRAPQPRGLSRRRRDQPVGHRPRPVRHGDAERRSTRRCTRRSPTPAGASTPSSSARILRTRSASAASPSRACCVEIGKRFNAELTGVPCIGDSLRDLQAAEAVGAQPMLVLTGKGEKTLREGNFPKNTVIFPDLAFAVSALAGE